ncbi:hypothetical protein DVH24_023358 [Malus domestica]|uniref:Uncharacterized protein n=1 Tax=Malus domestica TaxID=3750 RepID=A0A498KNR1_MALDO|nr:hypothetical protein DVH24_023358 [Malus domestica]
MQPSNPVEVDLDLHIAKGEEDIGYCAGYVGYKHEGMDEKSCIKDNKWSKAILLIISLVSSTMKSFAVEVPVQKSENAASGGYITAQDTWYEGVGKLCYVFLIALCENYLCLLRLIHSSPRSNARTYFLVYSKIEEGFDCSLATVKIFPLDFVIFTSQPPNLCLGWRVKLKVSRSLKLMRGLQFVQGN